MLARVELGEDPLGEKKGKRTIGTFKAIATEFIEHQERKRRASTVYVRGCIFSGEPIDRANPSPLTTKICTT